MSHRPAGRTGSPSYSAGFGAGRQDDALALALALLAVVVAVVWAVFVAYRALLAWSYRRWQWRGASSVLAITVVVLTLLLVAGARP